MDYRSGIRSRVKATSSAYAETGPNRPNGEPRSRLAAHGAQSGLLQTFRITTIVVGVGDNGICQGGPGCNGVARYAWR